MRHRLAAVLAVASLALIGLPGSATAAHVASPSPTVVTHLSPVTAAGVLETGYTITAHLGDGHCETGSEATANAYRCFSGRTKVLDPCWVTSVKSEVDCLLHPWAQVVTQLKVTKGYANYRGALGQKALFPWGVQLVDGTRCLFVEGASVVVENQEESYICPHSKDALFGAPIKTSKVWRLKEAKKTSGHYKFVGKAALTTAWFGIRSRKG